MPAGQARPASGYEETDTNKIARRAGFAPQTFYRWFDDKDSIFAEVYARWRAGEWAAIESALEETTDPRAVARIVVSHHVTHRRFRRSLRRLAVERPALRAARAAARRDQVARLVRLPAVAERDPARLASALLAIERLADAVAEEEFADLGIAAAEALDLVARAIARLFTPAVSATRQY
jgi:AcrR family transcriptional regulator